MAGPHRQENDEMQRRMQSEHLERQRRWIQQQPPERCPRCNSMETKFCYFNNHSDAQPRYYCKGCKRHWTKGGQLRNIPVGGTSVRPATASTLPAGGPMTRSGWTIPPASVSQLHRYYVLNPQGPIPLGLVRSARASTLPPGLITRPDGTIYLAAVNQPFGDHVLHPQGQNPHYHWIIEPGNIFCVHHFSPVYGWVDGFWHGPFYGTSPGPQL